MSGEPVNKLPPICIAETLTSAGGIVDLWYYFYEGIDAEVLAAHEALLSADERERHGSFYFDRDRQLFLATRALVRTVLSSYAAASPAEWRFATSADGKPYASAPPVAPQIHFNLANTLGLVVCVVSVAHEPIGVDAERIDREVEAVLLAERYFSVSERSTFDAVSATEKSGLFFAYWTLKESYLKARGVGLTLPTDRCSFLVDDEITVVFDKSLGDDATSWRFALLDAPPHHKIAVSVKTGGARLSLRSRRVVPLGRKTDPT